MKKKRMGASTVASLLNISKATAYNWKDGVSVPTKKNLVKLAEVLEIDIKDERVAWIMEEGKDE